MQNRLIFTVSELTRHIKASLEPQYEDIWVEGEISNMRIPSSGHCYFTLKDEKSQVRAVMFRMKTRLLRFVPEDGQKIVCRGRINVYEPRGEYQIVAEMMEPKGVGQLQLAFEQLKNRLQEEGLFRKETKKALPALPKKIAIITSPTGAAVRDIINITTRRFPDRHLLVVPVRVQGEEAPDEIAEALSLANRHHLADVILLARGGGSLEDLWAFNTEKVARAVAASDIPIISAVGHETDFTIADFVADIRAPTPSAGAEIVIKAKSEFARDLSHLVFRLTNGIHQGIDRIRNRVGHCAGHLTSPAKKTADYRLRIDDITMRLIQTLLRHVQQKRGEITNALMAVRSFSPARTIGAHKARTAYREKNLINAMRACVQQKTARMHTCLGRLNALNPLEVLERGYSITRQLPSHTIIKDAAQLKQGDSLNVTFSKGAVDCIVKKVLH